MLFIVLPKELPDLGKEYIAIYGGRAMLSQICLRQANTTNPHLDRELCC